MSIVVDLLIAFAELPFDMMEIFDPQSYYSRPVKDYREWKKVYLDKKPDRLISGNYIKKDQLGNYKITARGNKTISSYLERNLKIEKPASWDGKWRVIVFDIPEELRLVRDKFRRRLLVLDFVMIQKSVFCHSVECRKEIMFLIKLYELEPYVTYLETTEITTSMNIEQVFRKKGYLK